MGGVKLTHFSKGEMKSISLDRLLNIAIAVLVLLFVSNYAVRDIQTVFMVDYPELNPANGYGNGKISI